MLQKATPWLAVRLTSSNPVEAAVREEQLCAVLRAIQRTVAIPILLLPLVLFDLRWTTFTHLLPWLVPIIVAFAWMTYGSGKLLTARADNTDAAAMTLSVVVFCVPFFALWPTMTLWVQVPGNVANQVFLSLFLFGSMAATVLFTHYARHVLLASLAAYVPLIAMLQSHAPETLGAIPAALILLAGGLVVALAIHSEASFTQLAARSIEKEALASKLVSMAEELEHARDQAEEASRLKSTFLANMSHELRTPLNAIIGFSEIIRNQMFGRVEQVKYLEYAEDIHRSGQHLLNLINSLLDLAKIEAGKRELQDRELDLEAVAAHALRLVHLQARKGGVSLSQDLEKGFALLGDERAITQMLINLVSNSVKFTPPGGEVSLFSQVTDARLLLGVKDTGTGMAPEEVQRALEPFVQIAHHATVEGWGAGLGLPLVKAMIELHGGSFYIESHPGVGTCAWAEFPVERTIKRAQEEAALLPQTFAVMGR
ncbi:MAG: sensor histidine kinase [Alphaproteobacteria bacterium]|jgi:signal transduction histidine kinase